MIALSSVLVQIVLLDMVFSVGPIPTAVGITDNLAAMVFSTLAEVLNMLSRCGQNRAR